VDHSGWLPALVKHGYRGPIFASPATCDLARVMLLDSAHLQESDARRANRFGYSRHTPALPLYTRADALRALALFKPLATGRSTGVAGHTMTLTPMGHLLGACAISLQGPDADSPRLLFSGDVGRQNDLLMPPPEPPPPADVLLVESTYGNRIHPADDDIARLAEIIQHTVRRGGSVLMPAFAVGRAQALLLVLQRLKRSGAIAADIPIFLDSPMAIEATALYRQYGRLLRVAAREMRGLTDGVRMVATAQQSQRLTALRYPSVIIASSGMATGGRVLNHLEAMAPDTRHSIVFAGFQVGGSRGARMVGGEREIKVHGEMVPVRAEVRQLEGFSGHADRPELMAWLHKLEQSGKPPQQTFVVHGEPDASDTLRSAIQDQLHWRVRVPAYRECVDI
jgi:metallo-beta-lactamase family protein